MNSKFLESVCAKKQVKIKSELSEMIHPLFVHEKLFLIFSFIVLSTINRPVLATSISPDTLATIRRDDIYQAGYETVVNRLHYYGFSYPAGLIYLSKTEQKIYEAIQNLHESLRNPYLNKSVKEYMEDHRATSIVLTDMENAKDAEAKAQIVAGNLIGAYRMVRRFRNFIQPWMVLLNQNSSLMSQSELDLLTAMRSLMGKWEKKGPYRRDLQLTMIAIILTQFQLEWKAQNITTGNIKGMELGVTLEAVHCVEIGVHAIASRMYPIGIEWLQLAVFKVQNGDNSVQLGVVLPLLQKAKLEHDINWKPINGMRLSETFYEHRLNETRETKRLKWQRKTVPIPEGSIKEGAQERSWDVCSGKLRQTDFEKSKLFCWYEMEIHPTWKIGPLKVELHSTVPLEVVQFHNVLGGNIIDGVKAACPPLIPKIEFNLNPKSRYADTCETMKNTPLQASFFKLAGRITGLSVAQAEQIFPYSYPPGGHSGIHTDAMEPVSFKGRIATLLYYFDGPTIGGETAFPMVNLAVKALKGSAIFWYSRLKSSEVNEDAVHSACPVVQGQKFYGANWIHYDDQIHLVCDVNKNAMMEYSVNGQSKYLKREQK